MNSLLKKKLFRLIAALFFAINMASSLAVTQPLLTAQHNTQAEALSTKPYTGKPLTLDFQDIPIRSVLEILADFTHINIVANDTVKGNITLHLTNIPWDEALDIILRSHHLVKKQLGNTLLIASAVEMATQEKQLLASQQDALQFETLQTHYLHLNYAKASDIVTLLKTDNNTLLSARGNIGVDQRTNTLIIQDVGMSLINIQNMIAQLDIPVKQVLIEARIVNIDRHFERELGIRWGITKPMHISGTLTGANDIVGGVAPTAVTPLNRRLNVDLGAHIDGVAQTPSVGIALAKLGGGVLLDLELSAIEEEGGAELISSPRLVTANQHEAHIQQGQEIPFQAATSSGATSVEFKKAVLELRVTPQITPDNRIIMDIKVNQDRVNTTLDVAGVPGVDTREIQTNVLVNNGETLVLGGVYEEDKTKRVRRIPFLGSIPYVGALFKNTHTKNEKRELLIFITPKIIAQLPVTT